MVFVFQPLPPFKQFTPTKGVDKVSIPSGASARRLERGLQHQGRGCPVMRPPERASQSRNTHRMSTRTRTLTHKHTHHTRYTQKHIHLHTFTPTDTYTQKHTCAHNHTHMHTLRGPDHSLPSPKCTFLKLTSPLYCMSLTWNDIASPCPAPCRDLKPELS